MLRAAISILALASVALTAHPAAAQSAGAKAAESQAAAAILAYYPADARAAGIEGTASLNCTRTAHGAYRDCNLVSEAPPRQFFGLAALNIARASVENPKLHLGTPDQTIGAAVTFRFALSPPSITPDVLAPPHLAPKWARLPTGDEFAATYPYHARSLGIGGWAVIRCVAAKDGAMSGCTVLSEDPPDAGFGEAALKLTHFFRLPPTDDDGWPVEGMVMTLPMRYLPAPPG